MGGGDTSGVHREGPTTLNMLSMVVTLDVSHLEMSALKFGKETKRSSMSVMAETSKSAMGPCVAMAAVGSVSYAWTAVFREALSVKVAVKSRPELPCRVERRKLAMWGQRA